MKQKIYILGLITTLIIFLGTMFKVNHLPGAGILITIGIATLLLIFLPLALWNSYKSGGNSQYKLLYLITWLTCFVVFTSALFKIMHWPLAGYLLMIALPFPYLVFLPVFFASSAKNKNISVVNTVFVLFLLGVVSVFSVLLALNVSKERIDESYNLSRNYIRLEKVLKEISVEKPGSPLVTKIDETLQVVNNYQDLILQHEGLSRAQWLNNPGNLRLPEARQSAFEALKGRGEAFPGDRLEECLKNLIDELSQTQGYAELTKSAPVIFDYREHNINEHPRKFEDNNLSWLLIYLDGVETNLNMLRTFVPGK